MKKFAVSVLIFLFVGTAAFASTNLFTDVKAKDAAAINFVISKSLMSGQGEKFFPDKPVTRAEMAVMIEKLFKYIKFDEQQTIETVANILPYCVSIYGENNLGSGIIVGKGRILTANHCLKEDNVKIVFSDKKSVTGSVVSRLPRYDLAILEAEFDYNLEPLQFADDVQLAETTIAIGNSAGNDFTVSKGIVSNKARLMDAMIYIQYDAPTNHGSSGGPLFNLNGELIGIVSKMLEKTDADCIGYAIPSNIVKDFVEKK